jgi:hypothetical protein
MIDKADGPAVPAEDRDDAMRGQEGDQGDRRGNERCIRCGRAPADNRTVATATAKSKALSWASVRPSPRRKPITATAKSRTALTATHRRPLAPPINSGNCVTPELVMPHPRPCCHRRVHGPTVTPPRNRRRASAAGQN